MTTALLVLSLGMAARGYAADPAAQLPAVLQPLGQSVRAAASEPPSIRVAFQIAGNQQRAEAAVLETAERYGGQRTPQAPGKPEGPVYVQLEFPAASLRTQRQLLDRVVADIASAGAGVISGRREELSPTLEERKAEVAKETEALKAEQGSIRATLEQAPRIARIVDEQVARLSAFNAESEQRRGFLTVRIALESSPAHDDQPLMEKPRK